MARYKLLYIELQFQSILVGRPNRIILVLDGTVTDPASASFLPSTVMGDME